MKLNKIIKIIVIINIVSLIFINNYSFSVKGAKDEEGAIENLKWEYENNYIPAKNRGEVEKPAEYAKKLVDAGGAETANLVRLFGILADEKLNLSNKFFDGKDSEIYGKDWNKYRNFYIKTARVLIENRSRVVSALGNSALSDEEVAEGFKIINNQVSKDSRISQEDKKAIEEGTNKAEEAAKISSGQKAAEEKEDPKRIYTQPKMNDTQDTASASIDDMIKDGETFIHDTRTSDETTIKESDIQNLSQLLYNSLLIVGVVIAVIIGGIIGIKLMISSAEEKAEVKQYLVPYVAGCIIVFGAFGIWKLVVTILQNVNL